MRRVLLIGLLAGALAVSGCGSSNARSNEHYCATVTKHLTELNSPSIATPDDVARAVALYQSMSKAAPLAVEKEWDVLAIAYQTAATVTPSDATSMQTAVDAINGSQHSASAAADYTLRLCHVQVGTATIPTVTTAQPSASTTATGSTS